MLKVYARMPVLYYIRLQKMMPAERSKRNCKFHYKIHDLTWFKTI